MLSAFNVIFHLTLNIIWCQVMANNACIRYSLDGFSFIYYLPHNYDIVNSSNYFLVQILALILLFNVKNSVV